MPIPVLIYGPKGAGKTAATLDIANRLRARGLAVSGFFQRRTVDAMERKGYDLVRFPEGAKAVPLARPATASGDGSGANICSFVFSREAFAEGRAWLGGAGRADVLVIDEVSKLEVAGDGHYGAVRDALLSESSLVLLSIRGDQLFYVVEKFAISEQNCLYLEVPASDAAIAEFVNELAASAGA